MEAWTLLQLDPAADRSERGWHWLSVIGRLRRGMDRESAGQEVAAIMAGMYKEHPNEYDDAFSGSLTPAAEHLVGDIRPILLVLLGAVALLLLIAASNVASLFLARAEERHREIAVRAALGARAGRIVRQRLTESATLGVAGGAAALPPRARGHPDRPRAGAGGRRGAPHQELRADARRRSRVRPRGPARRAG